MLSVAKQWAMNLDTSATGRRPCSYLRRNAIMETLWTAAAITAWVPCPRLPAGCGGTLLSPEWLCCTCPRAPVPTCSAAI